MAAATANRDGQRQPGELIHYSGASGYKYFKNTLERMIVGIWVR